MPRVVVARQLYEELERIARSAGITVLFIEASEPAMRFFEKRGFEQMGRHAFELNGVEIHN